MDNFVVSARKYRPTTFSSVVGQPAITSTLKNAIKNNQLAQAFLFCGPRGVGKTTCARILAKTINCFNKTPEGEACNLCESCVSFNNGQSLNIYELDAASNNSVDDIRTLIEQVRFAPQLGKYKVYIIDEVHMLSTAAFNAFLKTLEEPPAHAIFILATTEKHKVLPTILSRCQRFDFNRITVEDISKHLAEIAQKENIEADVDALHIIAAKADGGLRDALSMFDQLVSFNGGRSLTYQSVLENLHILDYEYYFKVGDFMVSGNIPGVLLLFNEVLANGFDGLQFISGLAEHLRNLLVCKDQQTLKLLEVSENVKAKYAEQSALIPQDVLLSGIGICTKTEISYRSAKNQRLLVEYALLQIVSLMHQPVGDEKKNDYPVIIGAHSNVLSVSPQPDLTPAEPKSDQHLKSVESHEKPTTFKEQTTSVLPVIEPEKGKPNLIRRNVAAGISINKFINLVQKPETGTITTTKEDVPAKMVDEIQLRELWQKFAERYNLQKRSSLFNALTQSLPTVNNENFEIVHYVANKTLQNEVDEIKDELLSFLRNELHNFSLKLTIVVNEAKTTARAYTPLEKFSKLMEKNPLLLSLKQKLDLEIEF